MLKKFTQLNNSLLSYVIYYFAWALVVSPFAYYQADSLVGVAKLFVYFAAFLAFCFLLSRMSEESMLKLLDIFFMLLILVTTLFSIYGIYQYFAGAEQFAAWDDPNYLLGQNRVYSIFGNPNLFAAFLLMVIPINFFIFVFSGCSGLIRWALGLMLTLNSMALFLTGSRSGIFAFSLLLICGLLFSLWKLFDKRSSIKIVLIALLTLLASILIVISVNPELITRVQTIFLGDQYSTNAYRMEVWQTSLELIKENCIIGIGIGNDVFRKVYALYMKPGFEALSTYSVFLKVFVETGVIGASFFVLILLSAFKTLWMAYRRYPSLSLLLGTSLLLVLAQGLFDTVMFRPPIFLLFWFLLAVVVTLRGGFRTIDG